MSGLNSCSVWLSGTASAGRAANQALHLTGAAILVSRGMKVLQAAPAAYPDRELQEHTTELTTEHGCESSLPR